MKRIAATLLALLSVLATPSHASLAGDTIDVGIYKDFNIGWGVGRINGYGLDAPFLVQEGNADLRTYSSVFTLDVSGSGFAIDFLGNSLPGVSSWSPEISLRFDDLDFDGGASFLSSLSVNTNLVGYTLSLTPDSIHIGLGNVGFSGASYFNASFNVASVTPVPEPATVALMGAGLAGLAAIRRRRTGQTQPA